MRIGTTIEPKKIARAFLSTDSNYSLTNEAKRLINAGANHIEINGEAVAALPGPLRDKFAREASGGLQELHEKEGITFSIHLPFLGGVNFTTSIDPIRRASIDVVKDITEQSLPLEPIVYVLHISGLLEDLMGVGVRDAEVIEAYLSYAAESLAQIVEFVPAEKLCIENLEYIAFEKIFPLVEKFDTKVCMDVGHIKLRNEDIGEFIDKYGSRVGQVHMHGVTWRLFDKRVRVMDDHQGLGSGIIDVIAVIQMLRAAGFDGPVVLEIQTEDPIGSVRILKEAIEKAQKG
ncbi:MAG: sugar phosphate isomerase/epimerase [Candidatus Hydrogenedentota bacterium]|nr:MAG: sugar phosphate isomerase/epimerase [Candidatus Hydrogenedentota bacterium]